LRISGSTSQRSAHALRPYDEQYDDAAIVCVSVSVSVSVSVTVTVTVGVLW